MSTTSTGNVRHTSFTRLLDIIGKKLPKTPLETFVDVGANTGQTTRKVRQHSPGTRIFAFEPVRETFEELETAFGADPNVTAYNTALSSSTGSATMEIVDKSVMNRIVTSDDISEAMITQSVKTAQGDDFFENLGIQRISLLKIDTEGHDQQVLLGFNRMLHEESIDILQVEAGMNSYNTAHVPLTKFVGYLNPIGYELFHLHEIKREWIGPPRLRRVNAVFISSAVATANSGT